MIYAEFLQSYAIHLGHSHDRQFTQRELASGWQEWQDKPYRNDGLCYDRDTLQFYRYTTTVEMRGRLQWAIYHRGPEVEWWDEETKQYFWDRCQEVRDRNTTNKP